MPIPSHTTELNHHLQTHLVHKFLAIRILNQFYSTHCSYRSIVISSQNGHLILPQTSCLISEQHPRPYTTLINSYLRFQRKFSFMKQVPALSKVWTCNSRSCCHRCFTSTTGIQSVPQVQKLFTNFTWSYDDNSLAGSTVFYCLNTYFTNKTFC